MVRQRPLEPKIIGSNPISPAPVDHLRTVPNASGAVPRNAENHAGDGGIITQAYVVHECGGRVGEYSPG